MDFGVTEDRGRFTLRALLWLLFLCHTASEVLVVGRITASNFHIFVLLLLPTAMFLCAIHRGSWLGLVVLFIGTFNAIGAVTGALADGGLSSMATPQQLVAFVDLLLRLTVVFCLFRNFSVGRYLAWRRERRRRRDDVLEVALFVLFLALQLAVLLLVLP